MTKAQLERGTEILREIAALEREQKSIISYLEDGFNVTYSKVKFAETTKDAILNFAKEKLNEEANARLQSLRQQFDIL